MVVLFTPTTGLLLLHSGTFRARFIPGVCKRKRVDTCVFLGLVKTEDEVG